VGEPLVDVVVDGAECVPSSPANTADGMFAEPSTSTTLGGRPCADNTATVLDVPRSTDRIRTALPSSAP
jgi:hypothetical protein